MFVPRTVWAAILTARMSASTARESVGTAHRAVAANRAAQENSAKLARTSVTAALPNAKGPVMSSASAAPKRAGNVRKHAAKWQPNWPRENKNGHADKIVCMPILSLDLGHGSKALA